MLFVMGDTTEQTAYDFLLCATTTMSCCHDATSCAILIQNNNVKMAGLQFDYWR